MPHTHTHTRTHTYPHTHTHTHTHISTHTHTHTPSPPPPDQDLRQSPPSPASCPVRQTGTSSLGRKKCSRTRRRDWCDSTCMAWSPVAPSSFQRQLIFLHQSHNVQLFMCGMMYVAVDNLTRGYLRDFKDRVIRLKKQKTSQHTYVTETDVKLDLTQNNLITF